MTYRDYEGIRAKTCCEYKLQKNKHTNFKYKHTSNGPLENGPLLVPIVRPIQLFEALANSSFNGEYSRIQLT